MQSSFSSSSTSEQIREDLYTIQQRLNRSIIVLLDRGTLLSNIEHSSAALLAETAEFQRQVRRQRLGATLATLAEYWERMQPSRWWHCCQTFCFYSCCLDF